MPPGTILVVDDSKFARRMTDIFLKPLAANGARIVHAEHGKAALDILRGATDARLVLLDLEMPGMTGLEFLTICRADAHTRRVPVVVISSSGDPEVIRRAMNAGADGYVIKPFHPEEFYQVVQGVLDKADALTGAA